MKKFVSCVLVLAVMLSITSCYSERMISSPKNMNEVGESDVIISLETKDGRTIQNERPKAVYKSEKGFYVVDTTGSKLLPYSDVNSVKVEEISYFKMASLVGAAVVVGYIAYFVTSFHGFK